MTKAPDWKRSLPTFAAHLSKNEGELWMPYPHLVYLAERIGEKLVHGGRYIINMPPRHGKSELLSHWLPTWFLEVNPELRVIITSYEHNIATDFGRKVRDSFNSDELWTNVKQDVRAANRWHTHEGGGLVTAGVDSALTGRGGQLILIDDPYKNWLQAQSPAYRKKVIDWFKSTLYTRKEPNATIILIQTRWHQNDLTGWLENEHSDNWEKICLPALAEDDDPLGRNQGQALCSERYDETELAEIKQGVGTFVWTGMYQQRPVPAEGAIYKEEWIRYWDEMPTCERVIQSWDAAFKKTKTGSFVTGQAWGTRGADFFLLGQRRDRIDFVQTLRAIQDFTGTWTDARAKLVEDKANGPAIISTLKNTISGIIPVNPQGSKIARAQAVAPLWEAGNVYIPNPNKYPWVHEFLAELLNFPSAAHDDQVDAMSQALNYLDSRKNITVPEISFPDGLTAPSTWGNM